MIRAKNTGDKILSKGILITSSDFSKNVYEQVEQIRKTLPVEFITEEDFTQSNIDWEASDFKKNELKLRTKKELRPHQREALEHTKEYFEPVERTRGKIIMACGTGKTLTALRIIETLCPKEGKVCFFAPSIALVAQTFREFLKERKKANISNTALQFTRKIGDIVQRNIFFIKFTLDGGKSTVIMFNH